MKCDCRGSRPHNGIQSSRPIPQDEFHGPNSSVTLAIQRCCLGPCRPEPQLPHVGRIGPGRLTSIWQSKACDLNKPKHTRMWSTAVLTPRAAADHRHHFPLYVLPASLAPALVVG